jgi:PAS domain S-box-containing protein
MFDWFDKEKNKYKSIFELSPEAIVIIDPKGNIVDINGRVYDWLGFKTEELIGKKLGEAPFLNKESQIRAQENFIKRMTGTEILPYELDFVTKKGEKVVGRVIGSPIKDKNKKITSVIIMISDITKYKESDDALKESEEKYRRLVNLAQEGIWLIDDKVNTTFVNPRMAEMLGYKPEEMMGKHLFSFTDEKGKEIAKVNIERRKKGIKEQHDFEFLRKDGSRIYTSLETSSINDKDGKYLGALAVVADITQRKLMEFKIKESEEKYKNIISSSPEAITLTDLNGRIIYCNQATLDLFELLDKKEIVGKTCIDFVLPLDKKNALKNIEITLRLGLLKNVEYTFLKKDGQKFPVDFSASVIKDSDGKPKFIMNIIRDISEQKRVERAKSEFTSLASHQLRTPLSIMNWYTEMILDGKAGKLSQKQKKYLKEIYIANNKLIKLVNLLLNISRIDLGTFVINISKTDLVKTVNSTIKDLLPQIREKKIKIEKNYPRKSFWIDTDPNIVNIVFQNLLSNSVRYMDKGGKIIINFEKQKSSILIQVSDTGYGIPQNQQPQIFSRFFRAENVKQKDTSGIGLGLYIVKSVIKEIDGEIWFESKEKEGTTFYVRIPLEVKKNEK